MRTFERQVEKIANQLKTGNMDMAILRDKFIQIGWWSEEREIAEELHIQAVEIVNDYFNEKIRCQDETEWEGKGWKFEYRPRFKDWVTWRGNQLEGTVRGDDARFIEWMRRDTSKNNIV